jgi:hypothetical protein
MPDKIRRSISDDRPPSNPLEGPLLAALRQFSPTVVGGMSPVATPTGASRNPVTSKTLFRGVLENSSTFDNLSEGGESDSDVGSVASRSIGRGSSRAEHQAAGRRLLPADFTAVVRDPTAELPLVAMQEHTKDTSIPVRFSYAC